MQRTDVIHCSCADHHQCADDQRAIHIRQREPQIGLQTLPGLLLELEYFEFLPTKCVDHPNRAETFLRLHKDRALPFLDGCRFATDSLGEQIDCANN